MEVLTENILKENKIFLGSLIGYNCNNKNQNIIVQVVIFRRDITCQIYSLVLQKKD
jgi:hypothetical protein